MKKKRIYQILILVVLTVTVIGILVINKTIKITPVLAGRFEVAGVDVSHYQGKIDWEKLAGQDLDFAFIKATEGSSHVDEYFDDNWQEAGKTNLCVGAYHFFSFDSDGEKQAELYIDTVGELAGKVVPAVDVEFYGDKESNPPPKDEVNKQLRRMLETLEGHYQVRPVIYTTYKAYHAYIKGEFDEYPLWIRNVYYQPFFTVGNRWTFWQYTDTAVLEGYQGTEKYIDLNVFRGTREELEKLIVREDGVEARDEVFTAVEEGDFSVVARKYSDPDGIVELLQEAYESDGDTRRTQRCDIDGDGFDELLLLIKYEFEDYEQIDFILDYRNGRAVCIYFDWCDGNEWLLLGDDGKLIHCSHSNNGSCDYYGFKECTLNARGIKDIDYTGYGIEVIDVYESVESGLWCWEGQQPEITQRGIYFAEVRSESAEEAEDTGTAGGWAKKLIGKEQFLEEYKELTGKDFTVQVDLERADIIVTGISGNAFSIGYTDKDRFLRDFDFEDKEPFYQYLDENGELQLELYYDERTANGCGIRYYPGKKQTPQGFHFHANVFKNYLCDSEFLQERLNADPYELLANGRVDLSKDEWIEDYEEDIEYTSDGRPKHFKSQGWITYFGEEHELQKLLDIEFTYREDGTLKMRDYAHHTVALETWCSVVHSFYDTQERLAYEDCYITHGSRDYYYIYQGEETIPSYCLVLDHDLGSLYAEVVAIHEMIEDEAGKRYGIVGPDLSNNNFVKAVREAGDYRADQISHTYEEDYDGDGYYEAFVIIGNCEDMWGEVAEDYITGDLWFVDHDKNAAYLQKATFDALQEYIRQDGKTYLFLNHDIGLPWMTDIYTVQDNEPVICAGESNRVKYLSKAGQVIQTQDAYDSGCDIQDEFGWSGHTWKPYTYEFDHGELREIGAEEATLEDVIKIARLPEDFDEKEYDGVQYILRDNGELNINTAAYDEEFGYIGFNYLTYYADRNGEWELTDEGPGIYRIQLDGESCWDYLEDIISP